MGQAPRDGNFVHTALLWDAATPITRAWRADSATGRALIYRESSTPQTPTLLGPPAKRDGNYVPTLMALIDGTSTLIPLICDTDGNLVCVAS